jgi:hypothetical protein
VPAIELKEREGRPKHLTAEARAIRPAYWLWRSIGEFWIKEEGVTDHPDCSGPYALKGLGSCL